MVSFAKSDSESPVLWYAWTPPAGIRVDNLRKRGIDMLRIGLRGSKQSNKLTEASVALALMLVLSGFWFDVRGQLVVTALAAIQVGIALYIDGRIQRNTWYVTIAPGVVTVTGDGDLPETKQLNFADIKNVSVQRAKTRRSSALSINTPSGEVSICHGHPLENLTWLKNILIMEIAGLSWKPLHGVDRNRSRKQTTAASNPIVLTSDLALRLIQIYLALSPDVLEQLRQAVVQKNPDFIRQHAHWLKSASANIGARSLSEHCQRMEIYGITNDLERTEILLLEISAMHADIVHWLQGIRDNSATSIAHGSANESLLLGEVSERTNAEQIAGHAEEPIALENAAALRDARVLVVDDSAVNRELAGEYLRGMVTNVTFAHDAAQALKVWEENTFDLILMDCEMEGMDGYECVRKLRQKERLRDGPSTPIIALTAHTLKGDRQQCIAAGMDDYLSKPYAPEDLEAIIDKWLNRELEPADADVQASAVPSLEFMEIAPRPLRTNRSAVGATPKSNETTAPQGKTIMQMLRTRVRSRRKR